MTYTFLQNYWWFIISLLGALLVFLMFVQGGNALLLCKGLSMDARRLILNTTGRKWELSFTTLVTFGGAFFASFPLFYSTSFGGAYWVWILLLLTFVFQAVSYEFHSHKHNLLGRKTFRIFLIINGLLAPFIIGAAVGTFFTGSPFVVEKDALLGAGVQAISRWGSPLHGLEALARPLCLLLGFSLMFLDLILGALYILNSVQDTALENRMRMVIRLLAFPFLVIFVVFLLNLLLRSGYAVAADGSVVMEPYKYLHNLLHLPVATALLVAGVLLVLWGLFQGGFTHSRKGIWFAGLGTVMVVLAVFFVAGYAHTAYYPSSTDLQSSLTLQNSASSPFTLRAMFYVSLAIPFVVAYIAYAWRQMNKKPLNKQDLENPDGFAY